MGNGLFDIFDNITSNEYTEIQKLIAVNKVLNLKTHNGFSKEKIIEVFRWFVKSEEFRYCAVLEELQRENEELKAKLERLVELSSKIGDTVYSVWEQSYIGGAIVTQENISYYARRINNNESYLTREEAEQALKEINNDTF